MLGETGEIRIAAEDTSLAISYPYDSSDEILLTIENTYRKARTIQVDIEGDSPTDMMMVLEVAGSEVVSPDLSIAGDSSETITLALHSTGFVHESGQSRITVTDPKGQELDAIDVTWESTTPDPEDTLLGHIEGYGITRSMDISYEGYPGHVRDLSELGNWSMLFSSGAIQQTVIDCGTHDQAEELVRGKLSTDISEKMQLTSSTDDLMTFGLSELANAVLAGMGLPFGAIDFSQETTERQIYTLNGKTGYCWRSQLKYSMSIADLQIFGDDVTDTGAIVWNDGCFVYVVDGGPFSQVESVADSLPAPIPHEGTPGFLLAGWTSDQQSIDECFPLQPVSLEFKVVAIGGFVKKPITLQAIADIPLAYDQTIDTWTRSLDLDEDQIETIKVDLAAPSGTRSVFVMTSYEDVQIYETPADERLPVSSPVLEAGGYFEQQGSPVEEVDLRSAVTARATLRCTRGYAKGQAEIQVKKDIALGTDTVFARNSASYELRQGESVELFIDFAPDQASGTGDVRGYFLKVVYDSGEQQMADFYPPRLIVTKPILRVSDLHFEQAGARVTEVEVGTEVMAEAMLQCEKGHAYGMASLQVKDDLALATDTICTSQTFQFDLEEGETMRLELPFTPESPSKGDHRGYFIKIILEGSEEEMAATYPPRLMVRETQPSGQVSLSDTFFMKQGARVTEVSKGDPTMAFVTFTSTSGPVSVRNVKIIVRKDISMATDETVATFGPFDLSSSGKSISKGFSFVPESRTGDSAGFLSSVRGYFLEVTWDGGSYTMPDGYPPRLTVR